MSTVLYPWGYQRALVTEERLWQLSRIDDLCDPATARRFKAYIRSKGGKMGIGGAVRFVQPVKEGFAPPGASFHELQVWFDKVKNFAALDLVMRNGTNIHRSPTWAEVPKQGSGHPDIKRYGVHANVTGEPWHLQAIEIDGWQTWVNNGRRRPSLSFPLPDQTVDPTPSPTPPPPGTKTYAPGERVLRVTDPQMEGIDVAFVQSVIRDKSDATITVDGEYGKQTAVAVENLQRLFGLTVDGVVGLKETWPMIIQLSRAPVGSDKYELGVRTLRLESPTMKGTDVQWVQNVIKNQGIVISADGVYGRQTRDRVLLIQSQNNMTQDGVVGPKTWEVLKKY